MNSMMIELMLILGDWGIGCFAWLATTVVVIRAINGTQASWRVEVKPMLMIFLVVSCQIVKNEAFISFSPFLIKKLETCRFLQIVRWGLRNNWQLLGLSNLQQNFLWHFMFWMNLSIHIVLLNRTWLANEKLKWPFIFYHVSWKLQHQPSQF